jgi:DNA-binding transcriptional MerR regulator
MARRSNSGSRRGGREMTFITRTVLCSLAGVSERELRVWEREELIAPARIAEMRGHAEPLYATDALRRARLIRTLEDLEVNIPGITVILNLLDQMDR